MGATSEIDGRSREVPLLAGLDDEQIRRMLNTHPSFGHAILETMAQRVQILQSIAGQRGRLDSLGTLAAGLTHELNNPASAARRAARSVVPKGIQNRVSEPFFTTKGVGAGTGFGLDLSYRVVVGGHEGDIRVESRPGETRLQVRLPLAVGGPVERTLGAAVDGLAGDALEAR